MDASRLGKIGVPLVAGGIAAIAAHQVYPELGLNSALIVLFCVGWLVYRFTSGKRVWNTFSFLKNPPIAGMIGFFLSFIYFSFEYRVFPEALLLSIGFGIIGVAVGALFYKYWNIGG